MLAGCACRLELALLAKTVVRLLTKWHYKVSDELAFASVTGNSISLLCEA